jgi:antitoxin YefM
MSTVTCKQAKAKLERLWDETISTREPVLVRRHGRPDLALLPADELAGLLETAHLLRSPRNARRLLESLRNVNRGKYSVMTLAELREQTGMNGTRH